MTPGDPTVNRNRFTAFAIVLLLATIFIAYGSLYPFQYYDSTYPDDSLAYLMSTWRDWDNSRDLLPNILLYLPLLRHLRVAAAVARSGAGLDRDTRRRGTCRRHRDGAVP